MSTEAQLSRTLARVARYYEDFLWHESLGAEGRALLRARGVPFEQAKSWRLGLAPKSATFMTRILARRGVTEAELCDCGVAKADGRAGYFELLRARLVFPHTLEGRVVGFSGRILPGRETSAKYLSTCQTPLFNRARALFGLDQARPALARGEAAVLVEGPLDALALHRAGVGGAVALEGVSFSSATVESLVAAGARSLVLLLDGDAAGGEAAVRMAISALTHPSLPTSVAVCPDGLDPDELVGREPAAVVRDLLTAALPAADFLVARGPSAERGAAPELLVRALDEFARQFPTGFEFSAAQIEVVAARLRLAPGLVGEALTESGRSESRARPFS